MTSFNPVQDIRDLHEAFGIPSPSTVTAGSRENSGLRRSLIAEEYREVMGALYALRLRTSKEKDSDTLTTRLLADLGKELVDLMVVTIGTGLVFGLPLEEIWDEVHRSNMSKCDADGKVQRRSDGKVLKGEHYSPADIMSVLADTTPPTPKKGQ